MMTAQRAIEISKALYPQDSIFADTQTRLYRNGDGTEQLSVVCVLYITDRYNNKSKGAIGEKQYCFEGDSWESCISQSDEWYVKNNGSV